MKVGNVILCAIGIFMVGAIAGGAFVLKTVQPKQPLLN